MRSERQLAYRLEGAKFARNHLGGYHGNMLLHFLLAEGRALLEKGVPNKDRDRLHYPNDCRANKLRRAADRDPLHLVPGGEHDRVVDPKGNTLTTIPHGDPSPGVCHNVIKVLNDPSKAAAHMPRFRGQAVREDDSQPFHTGDTLEVLQKGGNWWTEMRKGALLTVTGVSGSMVKVREKYDIMRSDDGWQMKVEPGQKTKPGSFKLVDGGRFARYLLVKKKD